jgi:antirestriction protein ArdC
MNDIYTHVTERIISSLEAGVPPWIQPWAESGDGIPANAATDRRYRGINVLLLNLEAQLRGFRDSRWLTFRQAALLGGHVRKGEHGAPIVFFKWRELETEQPSDEPTPRVVPMVRTFTVFNVGQIDGLPPEIVRKPEPPPWSPIEEAEHLVAASGAVVREDGNRAFYSPSEDAVQVPPRSSFEEASAFYAVLLHEMTHWTGHPTRCNRSLGRRHGLEAYAFEELVAEMGAAFLCAHCSLPARLEHATYIESWLQALRGDRRLVFTAAAKAQAAADFVLRAAYIEPSPEAEALAA